MAKAQRLIIILGDQLDLNSVLPADYRKGEDLLWMCEARSEATRAWSHKARLVMFLAAMRHFASELESDQHRLVYRRDCADLSQQLGQDLKTLAPQRVCLTRPGDYDLRQSIIKAVDEHGLPLDEQDDPHFLCSVDRFKEWAKGRKTYRMEFFYREMRREHAILLDADGQPRGGQWNFDADNRDSFGKQGPGALPAPLSFAPDACTERVIQEVEERYSDHPGQTQHFDWPVQRADALKALDDFVHCRLAQFGQYQDAIWMGEPWLYHSRIAAALNLHLLHPQEVITAAIGALEANQAPLNAVEGFVRQILGWREYVRGLYWLRMPQWRDENHLQAALPLPEFFWTGDTDMACLQDAIEQTLNFGYAHHIQRLMITGLFCLLAGVRPQDVHGWYLAVYVDAVEWVELPNTLGMSQFVDGGVLASKPYIASGAYISRMSNACSQCRYNPKLKLGAKACPITTLYWDFLRRHEQRFAHHPRLKMQLRNLQRLDDSTRDAIRDQAQSLRQGWTAPS